VSGAADASLGPVVEDGLLDRAVRLHQPQAGYRAGSDAVLLAASVPAKAGERVLDPGAGVGAVGLCLARRVPDLAVVGLEWVAELAALGNGNAALNGMADRVRIVTGDIRDAPAEIRTDRFDHVVCNPPFHEDAKSSTSPTRLKAVAHSEGDVPLADWVGFCLRRCRPGGTVTLIHRASRLPDLLMALSGGAGDILICPLWPAVDRPAGRVIVQGRVQRRGPPTLLAGLAMHDADGADTAAARSLLRAGAALDLRAMAARPSP